MQLFIFAIISFLISLLITFLIKKYFSRKLLDIPNNRSSHIQPTPRGGGLGFVLAFAFVTLSANALQINSFETTSINISYLWLMLTPLVIIGILDDRYNLSAKTRYLIQFTVAIIVVIGLSDSFLRWSEQWGMIGQIAIVCLSVVGFTALVNFYNFMDGLDGLVASVTAIQLAFIAFYYQQPLWWLLSAALLGFLYWNWSPAKIFMGDVGSTFLGATMAIAILNANDNIGMEWGALAITLSLTGDAIYTLACRLIRRENIFQAHRTHLYQRLQQSGFSHDQVAITYCSITMVNALLIFNFSELGNWLSLFFISIAILVGEIYLKSKIQNSD